MNKKELRKLYSNERENIVGRKEKDMKIAERVIDSEEVLKADTILIYISFGSETDTGFLISYFIKKGKKTAVPKCSKNGIMEFIYISSPDELSSGMYGIPEPTGNERAVITENTLCIVPALAFTEKGVRLGYGGGYYDRFLSKYSNINTIGIGYECMIKSELPSESFDVKIKKIITEERTVLCSANG